MENKKDELVKEIMDLREDLFQINEQINNLTNNKIEFFYLYIPPIVIAFLINIISIKLKFIAVIDVGIFMGVFILCLGICVLSRRSKIKKKKEKLIEKRIAYQRKIVDKSMKLKELEEGGR